MLKKLSLLLATFFMFVAGAVAQDVEIVAGDESSSTTSSFLPLYTYYDYSYSQMLYPEADCPGTINSVAFYLSSQGSTDRSFPVKIFMAEVNNATVSTSDYVAASDLTLVYDGNMDLGSDTGWKTLTLDSPFNYSGSGTLLIAVQNLNGSWFSAPSWKAIDGSSSEGCYWYRDGSVITPENPNSGYSNNNNGNKAVVKLSVTPLPGYCPKVKDLTASNITANSADFSWTAGGDETKWRIQITTMDDANWENPIASAQATSASYTRTGLNPQTVYRVRVQSICSSSSESKWTEATFKTLCDVQQVSLPWFENFDGANNDAIDCWTIAKQSTYSSYDYSCYCYVDKVYPSLLTGYYQYVVYSGSNALEFKGTDMIACLPAQFGNDLTNLRVRFMYRINSTSAYYNPVAKVGVMTDPSDESTWKELSTLSSTGTGTSQSAWKEASIPLAQAGTAKYIAIRFTCNAAYPSLYVDDITVEEVPACPVAPTNLAVTDASVTDNGATLTFSDEEGSEWEIFYKADNDEAFSKVSVDKETYTFNTLAANTHYTMYVSRVCNTGNKIAEQSNKVEFTTKYNCEKISGTLAKVDTLLNSTAASFVFKDNLHTAWTLYYKEADAEEYNTAEFTIADTIKSDTTVLATINGLTPTTNYVAYVTTACDGIAEPSNTVSFTTHPVAVNMTAVAEEVADKTFIVDFDNNNFADNQIVFGSTSTTNKWVIGEATGNTGKSLYLTSDNGTTNAYDYSSATKAFVAFKVDFIEGIDTYNFSFDYKAPSTDDPGWDDFKVALLDASKDPANTYTGSGYNWTLQGSKEFVTTSDDSYITDEWKTYAYAFTKADAVAGKSKYIVFWFNCDGSYGNGNAPAIDNIKIKAGVDCSLEINKRYTYQNVVLCAGENTTGMQPGDYVTVVPTAEWGCDSTITLHVKVAEETTIEDPINVFDNELPYVRNGKEYTESGNYTDSIASDGGCYDLTHFTLNVIPTYNLDRSLVNEVSICEGGEYAMTYYDYATEEDVTVKMNETRVYDWRLKSQYGADSLVIVDLTVNPVYDRHFEAVVCEGEIYDDNGFYKQEQPGEYDYKLALQTVNGCDSTVSLHLVVNPKYDITVEDPVLYNDGVPAYVSNGRTVVDFEAEDCPVATEMAIDTINGVASTKDAYKTYAKRDTLQAVGGCDSIVNYSYTVYRSYVDTAWKGQVLCNGEKLNIEYYDYDAEETKTVTYDATTTTDLVLKSQYGADSVLKIGLTVLDAEPVQNVDTAICFGGVFTLDGFDYTEAGTYTTTLQTEDNGCDYVVAYNVTVRPNYVKHEDVLISEGSSYIAENKTWNEEGEHIADNKTLTKTGEYTIYDTVTTKGECDSIYTVTLTVRQTLADTTTVATFCKGNSNVADMSAQGFAQLHLADGDLSWYKANHIPYKTADDQGITIDSLLQVMVVKVNDFDQEFEKTICEGESVDLRDLAKEGDVYVSGDKVVNATGNYSANFTREGCEYTLTLALTVNPKQTTVLDPVTLCMGETYKENNFNITAISVGTFTEVKNLKTDQGCDHTVTLTYTVLPLATETLHYTMKETEKFTNTTVTDEGKTFEGEVPETLKATVGEKDGKEYKTPKTYTYTKEYKGGAENGCDFTVTLNLTVNPVYEVNQVVTSYCNGDQPTATEGFELREDGNWYKDVALVSTDGYDSIIHLILKVNAVPEDINETKTICSAELPYTYKYNGKEVFDAPFTAAGEYTKTLQTENGCDYTITVTLEVNDVKTTAETHPVLTYCASETDEVVLPTGQTIIPKTLEPGTYTYNKTENLKTTKGCDSVVTHTQVVVINTLDTTYQTVADVCTAPTAQGFTLKETTEDGVKVWTNAVKFQKAETGCDSVVLLTIYQHPTYDEVIKDTVCQGFAYANEDNNFEVSADETAQNGGKTLTRVQNLQTDTYGCDSVVTLQLYVKKAYTEELNNATTFNLKMAVGETFNMKNSSFTFTASEEDITAEGQTMKLQFDTTTWDGCDSIVIINMTVIPAIAPIEFTVEQCQTATGAAAGVSGVYVNHRYNKEGDNAAYELCDTMTTTTIIINPRYDETISETINNGETFSASTVTVKHPVEKTEDGKPVEYTYTLDEAVEVIGDVADNSGETALAPITRTFTTEKGCEGIVTYNIKVRATKVKTIYDTICANANSIVPGFEDKTETGTYTLNLEAASGADSIVTLNLYVRPNYDVVVEDVLHIYDNNTYVNADYSYIWTNDVVFDAENPQIANVTKTMVETQTYDGCDSVVTLNLAVVPFKTTQQTIYVCSEEKANETNLSMERFVTADGVDSIVTYVVEVKPLDVVVLEKTICEGTSYTEHGFNASETGTYTNTVNENGCDQPYELHLTVTATPVENIEAAICEGESYVYDATHVFTTAGTHTFEITENDCTKDVNVTLTVNPKYTNTNTVTICEGTSYEFNGQNIATAGLYTANLTSVNGCDSVENLVLVVTPKVHTYETVTICKGNSIKKAGQTYSTAGEYEINYKTANGCDSLVTMTLVVEDEIEEVVDMALCSGETYKFHGKTYSTTGSYTTSYKNADGCTVNATLNLTVAEPQTETVEATICSGASYEFYGQNYTQTGTYTATYTNDNGCTVTVTLNLTVNDVLTENVEATICEGASYEFNGVAYSEAGTYTANLKSVNGCDSVAVLTLTVNPVLNEEVEATFCKNTSYEFYGQTLTQPGTYTATYTNDNGCAVNVTLTLTELPTVAETVDATICEGTSYEFDGEQLTQAGTYTATYTGANGCDSTVILNLTVTEKIYATVELNVCEGDTYELDGQTYTAKLSNSGTYTITTQSVETGCDSITTVILTVNPIEKTVETGEIPFEGAYQFNGKSFTEPGVYTETLQTVNGCDSIVTLVLTQSGIAEVENNMTVSLYPVPTYDDATLSVSGLAEDANVQVTDVQGRVIYTTVLANGQTTITIPSSTMAAGYYNVNIIVGKDRVRTVKLLKR